MFLGQGKRASQLCSRFDWYQTLSAAPVSPACLRRSGGRRYRLALPLARIKVVDQVDPALGERLARDLIMVVTQSPGGKAKGAIEDFFERRTLRMAAAFLSNRLHCKDGDSD